MTRHERRKRLSEMYRILGNELDQHLSNGSEFIYYEPCGADASTEVIGLRVKVLERVRDQLFAKADKLKKP